MHCFGGRGVLENLREQRTRSRLAAAALRDCCGENWSWHLGLCHCARPGVDGPALCYAHSQPTLPPPYSLHLTALLKYIKDVVQRRILIAQALSPHTTPPLPRPLILCKQLSTATLGQQPQQTLHTLLPRRVLSMSMSI